MTEWPSSPVREIFSNGASRRRFLKAVGFTAVVLILGGAAFLVSRTGREAESLGLPRSLGKAGRAKVIVGGEVFWLDIAAAPASQAKGLAGRNSIPADGGMIFLFDIPAEHAFWMKDMKFPIDIIWVKDEDVVFTAENVPLPPEGAADGELPQYVPSAPADKVIEVQAGTVKRLGVQAGLRVMISLPDS